MTLKIPVKKFIPAIVWFIIIIILLTLPASRLPQDQLFQIPQQDKIIHVVLFFILIYLFSLPFKSSTFSSFERKLWFIKITLSGLAFGIIMEFVQENFVLNRSYEILDIVADGVGCLFGFIVSLKIFLPYKKK